MRVEKIGDCTLYNGDMMDVIATLPESSVDSIVCDPPYHLTSIVKRFANGAPAQYGKDGAFRRASAGFMGQVWDGGDIAFRVETWEACLRVLKPGGYILAFASTRGFGRMSVALEDAGFITHPFIAWIFGSGFPKATRIKAEGYDGYRYGGQALKPAIEPIFMGQKPFSEANGTANILLHGTGALNIDGCRVAGAFESGWSKSGSRASENVAMSGANYDRAPKPDDERGRWPANVITDGSDEVLAAFPDAPGQQRDIDTDAPSNKTGLIYGKMNRHGEKSAERRYTDEDTTNFAMLPGTRRNDSGSAARFFYCAKASRKDREEGLSDRETETVGDGPAVAADNAYQRGKTERANVHPTVKPTALMEYLVRLVTPPNGTVLDPFMGSGSTGKAAVFEKMKFIGIEREEKYLDIATARIAWAAGYKDDPSPTAPSPVAAQAQPANDNLPLFRGAAA